DIVKDILRYARGFLCGVAPKDAFRPPRDFRGLPLYFNRMTEHAKKWRVVPQIDPNVCRLSDYELLNRIMEGAKTDSWHDDFLHADAQFMASVNPTKVALMRTYEKQVDQDVIRELTVDPSGVLPSFDHELGDLKLLEARLTDEKLRS